MSVDRKITEIRVVGKEGVSGGPAAKLGGRDPLKDAVGSIKLSPLQKLRLKALLQIEAVKMLLHVDTPEEKERALQRIKENDIREALESGHPFTLTSDGRVCWTCSTEDLGRENPLEPEVCPEEGKGALPRDPHVLDDLLFSALAECMSARNTDGILYSGMTPAGEALLSKDGKPMVILEKCAVSNRKPAAVDGDMDSEPDSGTDSGPDFWLDAGVDGGIDADMDSDSDSDIDIYLHTDTDLDSDCDTDTDTESEDSGSEVPAEPGEIGPKRSISSGPIIINGVEHIWVPVDSGLRLVPIDEADKYSDGEEK